MRVSPFPIPSVLFTKRLTGKVGGAACTVGMFTVGGEKSDDDDDDLCVCWFC